MLPFQFDIELEILSETWSSGSLPELDSGQQRQDCQAIVWFVRSRLEWTRAKNCNLCYKKSLLRARQVA